MSSFIIININYNIIYAVNQYVNFTDKRIPNNSAYLQKINHNLIKSGNCLFPGKKSGHETKNHIMKIIT